MKTHIKVLGPGCAKCKTLEKLTLEVVKEHQFEVEVSKVEDIMEIMNYGVMRTPALVINEKLVFSGLVPPKEDLVNYIIKGMNG